MVNNIYQPDWQIPKGVVAFSTTRLGGVSQSPYDSFNLGLHVNDVASDVLQNRQALPLSERVAWLNQIHSDQFVVLQDLPSEPVSADASLTQSKFLVCAVMTADCLPILLCDKEATVVSAIHAGWRGLASGIIENTLKAMPCDNNRLMAWIGPAISQQHFEVGEMVKDAFPYFPEAFQSSHNVDKFNADLPLIAQMILNNLGVNEVTLSARCTYQSVDTFFSHRHATHLGQSATGRQVSGIFLQP